jgi:NAD(P)-dependent dehydrogenase (short-subunit alcohol dehydrogenase family)
LNKLAETFEATICQCNVASEASVAKLTSGVLEQHPCLEMVINAAGGGYERTLGMYRVSRALLPALRRGAHKLLVNIPPSLGQADKPIFPYVSSRLAYCRLSAALASETLGTQVKVIIGCPATGQLSWVLPDPNAGSWADACTFGPPSHEGVVALAGQIASLLDPDAASGRLAS